MTYARNNLRLVIAVMMAVAAKATFGQSTNDIPPLLPALPELPPTFWEQYGIWITLGIILVIAAKGALIVAGGESGADAPEIYLRTLGFETGDDVLVEIVAGADQSLAEPGFVEQFAGLNT